MNSVRCLVIAVLFVVVGLPSLQADDWPQWRGPHRDGVWAETGIVEKFASAEIKLKWRVPISSGYSGPTVANGRVYVTDRLTEPKAMERVHCFDWHTGKTLWTHSYDCSYAGIGYQAGPRASVLLAEGRAYSLGTAGHLFCFDAASGKVLWSHDLRAEYRARVPNWGIAAAPLIEGDLLIVQAGGEGNACVCAFDKVTGRECWKALPDDASYSAPMVIDQAGHRVLVCWTGNRIVGLDPASGRLFWEYPFPWEKYPIAIATPVLHADMLLFSEAHQGTLLLRLSQQAPQVEKLWHRRKEDSAGGAALHCLISTPLIDGEYIYGVDGGGVLRCLWLTTGEQVWEDRTAVPPNRWATIHLIRHGEQTWMFNERGELIIARLTPDSFQEISRAKLIEPTTDQLPRRDGVTWSHPAFAYRHVFARNDKALVCADLSAPEKQSADDQVTREALWRRLEKYCEPPPEYAGKFGPYRSPLKFADGTLVKAPEDWARRRKEILATWRRRLGDWPPLVGRPTVKRLESIDRDGYGEHHVHVQISPEGKLADGYLLVPAGQGPFPAVLVPFYEPLTSIGRGVKGRGTHDYGLQLVRRGFVTLSIGTPGSGETIGSDTRQLLVEAGVHERRQPLGLLAYAAATCHTAMAQMPEVDPARIGIIGLSYGGKWSMFASCLYDKFTCAVWSDPGIVFNERDANVNYWEPWYLGYDSRAQRKPGVPSAENPRTGLYKELIEAGEDLVDLHALMAPRPVLVSGGVQDPPRNWQALNHLIAVNTVLGQKHRVAMTARPTHVPTAAALELELAFLEYWLK